MGTAYSTKGGRRGLHVGFWWESQKGPLGRPRHRWVDNSKVDIREIRGVGMDWIDLAQDMYQWWVLVKKVMNLQVL
jgi:hypothetical protein